MDDMKMQKPEVPVIVIERDEEPQAQMQAGEPSVPSGWRKWRGRVLAFIAAMGAMAVVLVCYELWNYYYNIGMPVSVSPSQNIEKLQMPPRQEAAEVIMSGDSILGVRMDFYAICGLKATLQFEEPDTADASVYLYCRSADHTPDGQYLGSLVAEGKEYQSDRSRLGYMAMAGAGMVIGVGRSDRVKDFVCERGGSFFRQFVLVSNGTIPTTRFHLRGKVERRAIGRKGNRLYYIATRYKETMWDFADALTEYGFVDVIYITGGTDYSFYRSRDGKRHDIGNPADYPHKKWQGIIPWLVFRKAD